MKNLKLTSYLMGKTVFPLRPRTKQGCPFSLFLFSNVLLLASPIRQEKNIRGSQTGQEVKLSLFSDNIIIHIENSMESTKKLQN